MAITTLRNTLWKFNSTIDISSFPTLHTSSEDSGNYSNGYYALLSFTCFYQFSNYTKLRKYTWWGVPKYSQLTYDKTCAFVSSTDANYGGTKGWQKNTLRVIYITGGSDAGNSSLIAWFQANAVQLDFSNKYLDGLGLMKILAQISNKYVKASQLSDLGRYGSLFYAKQSSSYRTVSDTEKETWNNKADGTHKHTISDITNLPSIPNITSDINNITGTNVAVTPKYVVEYVAEHASSGGTSTGGDKLYRHAIYISDDASAPTIEAIVIILNKSSTPITTLNEIGNIVTDEQGVVFNEVMYEATGYVVDGQGFSYPIVYVILYAEENGDYTFNFAYVTEYIVYKATIHDGNLPIIRDRVFELSSSGSAQVTVTSDITDTTSTDKATSPKYVADYVNKKLPSASTATAGQVLMADGSGGASWKSLPEYNGEVA